MVFNYEIVYNVICKIFVLDEYVGRLFFNVVNDVDFCNFSKKIIDYVMLVIMFGWFIMVILYVVYYVR